MYKGTMHLRDIAHLRELASHWGIRYSDLIYYAYRMQDSSKFKEFSLKKKNGGFRTIYSPCSGLMSLLYKIKHDLSPLYVPKKWVHGFVENKSIKTNALQHTRKRHVLNLDIKDFFGSIHFGRVKGLLVSHPILLNKDVSQVIAHLCCRESILFQGSPVSPLISNMIALRLDNALISFCRAHKLTYTRYADDISMSTNLPEFPLAVATVEPSKLITLSDRLKDIFAANGFSVNFDKVRLSSGNVKKMVTGLVVNDHVTVNKIYVKKIKAMLHAWKKFGYVAASDTYFSKFSRATAAAGEKSFRQVVGGKIEFVRHIREDHEPLYGLSHKLSRTFSYLSQRDELEISELRLSRQLKVDKSEEVKASVLQKVSVATSPQDIANAIWVVISKDTKRSLSYLQGSAFYIPGTGLITCFHCIGDPSTKLARGDISIFRPGSSPRKLKSILRKHNAALDIAILDFAEFDQSIQGIPCFNISKMKIAIGMKCQLVGYPGYKSNTNSPKREDSVIIDKIPSDDPYGIHYEVSARIFRGHSGGPVLDEKGEVIGVCQQGADDSKNLFIGIEFLNGILLNS
jgi:RNA-directed DNA polymerase